MIPSEDEPSNAGWFPDPEQTHTLRYWDGSAWTEQRAPATASITQPGSSSSIPGRYVILLTLAIVGAVIAVIGVFLPLADTAIGITIAENTMVQDPLGVAVIMLSIAAALMASFVVLSDSAPSGLLALVGLFGIAIALSAVAIGSNIPIEPINQVSEELLDQNPASPGSGLWAIGVGGTLILVSSLLGLDRKGWSDFLGL